MKSVISITTTNCKNCIKCIKECPTGAISIVNKQVIIDQEKCINCDICIQSCNQKSLTVEQIDLDYFLNQHEYNIALIPTALLSDLKSYIEIKNIAHAIKKIGFDEIVEYSDIEGMLYRQALEDSLKQDKVMITSFCPTINQLIVNEYPTLVEHLLPYDYPVEIAAKQLRKKYINKDIGIFSFCECIGKLSLAKYPFNNEQSNIDYALSISKLFPKINNLKNNQQEKIDFNQDGIKSIVSDLYPDGQISVISVEGLLQIKKVLELVEFEQLKNINLLALYNCFKGCIGGYYLWSNPFEGCYNIKNMLSNCQVKNSTIPKLDYKKEYTINHKEQNFKERLEWFKKVNRILETLPQFDCGSCGFANCRNLAIKIVAGTADDSLCRVKRR